MPKFVQNAKVRTKLCTNFSILYELSWTKIHNYISIDINLDVLQIKFQQLVFTCCYLSRTSVWKLRAIDGNYDGIFFQSKEISLIIIINQKSLTPGVCEIARCRGHSCWHMTPGLEIGKSCCWDLAVFQNICNQWSCSDQVDQNKFDVTLP